MRDPSEDPTRQSEDLGRDSIEATRLGLANIDRVADYLVAATCKPNEDYELLSNMYDQLLAQRNRELGHVTAMVGGFEQINLFFGDADQIYHPIPVDRQREAVKFLVEQVLPGTPPSLSIRRSRCVWRPVAWRNECSVARSRSCTRSSMTADCGAWRNTSSGPAATRRPCTHPSQLLADLTQGIWTELDAEKPLIDLYRRNLQRGYVELLAAQVNARTPSSDLPSLARVELQSLRGKIEAKKLIPDLDPLTKRPPAADRRDD